MATILNNCCTPLFLDFLKHQITKSRKWNFNYPMGNHLKINISKIDIIQGDTVTMMNFESNVSMSLLMMIHENKTTKY